MDRNRNRTRVSEPDHSKVLQDHGKQLEVIGIPVDPYSKSTTYSTVYMV